MHWAADLVGVPWAADAEGPHAFNCRGMVRECVRRRGLPAMPDVEDAADSSWRVVDDMQADDIVTMQGMEGPHVGFVAHVNGRLGVLHAHGHQTERGPVGMVEFHDLRDMRARGYSRFRFWRAAACTS